LDFFSLLMEEPEQVRLLLVEALFVFLAGVLRVLKAISSKVLERVGHVQIASDFLESLIEVSLRQASA